MAGDVWLPACVYFAGMSVPSANAVVSILSGGAAGAACPPLGAPGVCAATAIANPKTIVNTEMNRRNSICFIPPLFAANREHTIPNIFLQSHEFAMTQKFRGAIL
jgi:hypothetical protein